jgi:hypothetical protein
VLNNSENSKHSHNNMIEKRIQRRYSIRQKVYRQDTGNLFGYFENISLSGMFLKSTDPIPDKEEIPIWFGTGKEDLIESKIYFTVYKVWGAFSDTIPRIYNSGLYFVNPTEANLDAIQNLIDDIE